MSKHGDAASSARLLKSSSPDLKVFVGPNRELFEYHSVVMARHSDYIDTLLASGMKESTEMEISFPDIEVDVWLQMIRTLEEPLAIKDFTVSDALELVLLYHKYSFAKGLVICLHCLHEHINRGENKYSSQTVEICRIAEETCDNKLYTCCVSVFEDYLSQESDELCTHFLNEISPFVAKEERLLRYAYAKKDDVSTALWPEFFILKKKMQECLRQQNEGPFQVLVASAGLPEVNGVYHQDGMFENACKYAKQGILDGRSVKFSIFQCHVSNNTRHWYISIVPDSDDGPGTSADVDFYTCPVTRDSLKIPPTQGWEKAIMGLDPPPILS